MKSGDRRPTAQKAALAAFPDGQPVRFVDSHTLGESVRSCCGDDFVQLPSFGVDCLSRAFQFDDEHGCRTGRIPARDRRFGGFERQRVHDLHRAGQQPDGDHGRDGVPGGFRTCGSRPGRCETLPAWAKSERDLQCDAEQSFAADRTALCNPGRSFSTAAAAPCSTTSPVASTALMPSTWLASHAVLQAVRAAGVESNIATDGTDRIGWMDRAHSTGREARRRW